MTAVNSSAVLERRLTLAPAGELTVPLPSERVA